MRGKQREAWGARDARERGSAPGDAAGAQPPMPRQRPRQGHGGRGGPSNLTRDLRTPPTIQTHTCERWHRAGVGMRRLRSVLFSLLCHGSNDARLRSRSARLGRCSCLNLKAHAAARFVKQGIACGVATQRREEDECPCGEAREACANSERPAAADQKQAESRCAIDVTSIFFFLVWQCLLHWRSFACEPSATST